MNRTNIDWADMTWNPVTGCLHGCPYCYARDIARRFGGYHAGTEEYTEDGKTVVLDKPKMKTRKDGSMARAPFPYDFRPTFHRYRLVEPMAQAHPSNIFVCSMADLFGKWVPTDWIMQVLDACLAAPQHNYLFLTKNPERYLELDKLALLPRMKNFWYGTTTTTASEPYFYSGKHNTFISVEPMRGSMYAGDQLNTDWVIVGAETGNRQDKVRPKLG